MNNEQKKKLLADFIHADDSLKALIKHHGQLKNTITNVFAPFEGSRVVFCGDSVVVLRRVYPMPGSASSRIDVDVEVRPLEAFE